LIWNDPASTVNICGQQNETKYLCCLVKNTAKDEY